MGTGRGLTLLPLLGLPFAVHFAAVGGHYLPLFILFGLMSGLLILRLPLGLLPRGSLLLVAVLLLVAAASVPALAGRLLPFPPLLVFLVLAWSFGITLLPGRRPLVTRIAAALGDPLDAALLRYTRQVTVAWLLLFLLLAALTLVLWVAASRELWSLFTNFLAYALVLLMFAGEYVVRCRRFPFARERGFTGFLRALVQIDLRELAR